MKRRVTSRNSRQRVPKGEKEYWISLWRWSWSCAYERKL